MINNLWSFIKDKFDKMPQWVQVSTYLTMVAIFLVQFLSPRYIDIRLVGVINGQYFPLAEARVEIETEDRVIIMITDKQGRFSVPVGLANPATTYNFILYPDSKTMRQIDIEVGGHMAYSSWNKLLYSNTEDEYKFVNSTPKSWFRTAYANNELETSDFTQLVSEGTSSIEHVHYVDRADLNAALEITIEKTVIDAIATATNNRKDIKVNTELSGDLELGNYELSYVTFRIKEELNIDVSENIWRSVKTPRDIIEMSTTTYTKDNITNTNNVTSIEDKMFLLREQHQVEKLKLDEQK
ncbi:hypothetical protein RGG33_004560 [Vibrio parahaemolyticus]|nr:hypothetical protein [Vibrio parahaemolyticus]